jgi:ribose transport system permease protein
MLATGNMNLSVGAIGALSAIIFGLCLETFGLPLPVALLAAFGAAMACGWFNGFAMTFLGINSFIVTLSTLFIYTGFVYGISKGYPFKAIPASFQRLGQGGVLGLPILSFIMLAVLLATGYLYRHSVLGRHMLATGSNLHAAQLSGIDTSRTIMRANLLSACFACLAGLLWVSRLGSAQPATGQDWLIISFAVAIIGGTALNGGKITMIGLFGGALIMVLIKNGLIMMQANVYFEQAFLGSIILLTILLDRGREILAARAGRK